MAKRTRMNRKPAHIRYSTPSLEIVRLQLDALAHHPDPAIHVEALGVLDELRQCAKDPSLTALARLHGALDHALKFTQSQDRTLFVAPHSAVGRLYLSALWAAGPVPDMVS